MGGGREEREDRIEGKGRGEERRGERRGGEKNYTLSSEYNKLHQANSRS